MTIVTVTRHFSGFQNVADTFSIGNNEQDGSAAASEYSLPVGYSVSEGRIYDNFGIECMITASARGPVLISRAGIADDTLLQAA